MTHGLMRVFASLDRQSQTPIHRQVEERVRQAVASGEASPGQRLPTVRSMALALGVHPNTVARAYSTLVADGVLVARPGRGTFVAPAAQGAALEMQREARLGSIVARALVEAASLGFTPAQIESGFHRSASRFRERASEAPGGEQPAALAGTALVVAGSHDLALELLVSHSGAGLGPETAPTHNGSLGGLIALARGEAHVAGCHLLDEETGEYNVPFVRHVLKGVPVVVVTLVGRSQGLLVSHDNPRGITGLADLVRVDVAFINRQRGSGTRVLLDFLLNRLGIDPGAIRGYEVEAANHMEVAEAIVSGAADAGMGIEAAARARRLGFLPLQDERFDLVVPADRWDSSEVRGLRDALESPQFKDSVRELGGYDTTHTGAVVTELAG